MKTCIFLLVLILFIPVLSFGQYHADNSGYLITEKGDTIYGKFRACDDWMGCELKKFKTKDGERINAKKMKVVAYYHTGDLFKFLAIPPWYKKVFVKEIIKGDYIIYEHTLVVPNNTNSIFESQETKTNYYMLKDGMMVKVNGRNLNKFR